MTRSEVVVNLQALYGPPSQAGFGSAVFCDRVERAEDLEAAALKHYRYFLGKAWEQFGEEAWMEPWQRVYQRPAADRRDIVTELRRITDPQARSSVTMILDAIDNAEAGRQALSAVYDDAEVDTLVAKLLNTFPGCITKSVESVRKHKLVHWDKNKETNRAWLALNMMTEGRLGFRAFHEGTRDRREVDFLELRRALAHGRPWGSDLEREFLDAVRGEGGSRP